MPFKVHYEIFDNKHGAPDYRTYDFTMARVEWAERQSNPKGLLWRIEQTVMPDGVLNKQEEYLFLVYRVRKLTIYYRNNGQKEEDRNILMEHVRKLDKWNKQLTQYILEHPGFKPSDEKAHSFFVLVNGWRKAYYERQIYSHRSDYDHKVYREMTRKIRGFEKEIDSYIKQQIQLI